MTKREAYRMALFNIVVGALLWERRQDIRALLEEAYRQRDQRAWRRITEEARRAS